MLENPKKEVLRTDVCQGYRPNGAFFPPTILVSGREITFDKPHSTRAAETVTRGAGFIVDNISVGMVFSKMSNVLNVLVPTLANCVVACCKVVWPLVGFD